MESAWQMLATANTWFYFMDIENGEVHMLMADMAIFKKYVQCSLGLPKPILRSLSSIRHIIFNFKFKSNLVFLQPGK